MSMLVSYRLRLQLQSCFRALSSGNVVASKQLNPTLYIYVDEDIRNYLGMSHHDRKTRLFLRQDFSSQELTIPMLRTLVERKHAALKSLPYSLRFETHSSYPSTNSTMRDIPLSVQAFVEPAPGIFPPVKPGTGKDYLIALPDPQLSERLTVLSFYHFQKLDDPRRVAEELRRAWKPFKVVGRVYVAQEGINAQMMVPSNVLSQFRQACQQVQAFSEASSDLFLNIDHEVDRSAFDKNPPFKALHVRVRQQVLSDGLAKPLDWNRAGREVSPIEWHEAIADPKAIVLDCRNSYESDVGRFENAVPLKTENFRDSWSVLENMLKDVPRDTKVLTYCTGGIRCVKINAYLEQCMNFTDVGRLRGGIVSYTREIKRENQPLLTSESDLNKENSSLLSNSDLFRSKFQGVNYVFDQRIGVRVTDDVLAACSSCGQPCDTHVNCREPSCDARIIQCSRCSISFCGCCSEQCRATLEKAERDRSAPSSEAAKTSVNLHSQSMISSDIDSYCEKYSETEPSLLQRLAAETAQNYAGRPAAARMSSGHLQGRVLAMLTSISRASSVLELGSFTGYSALCFAEVVKNRALKRLQMGERGGVLTCEINEEAAESAQRYIDMFHEAYTDGKKLIDLRKGIHALDLIEQARKENWKFDVVFIDADKKSYEKYLRSLLGEGTRAGSCLLNDGALILVDNVLWKKLVLNCNDGVAPAQATSQADKQEARQRALAQTMHDFNRFVNNHALLSVVILPIRDGLSCIRYHAQGKCSEHAL